jgi:hypothetical protein
MGTRTIAVSFVFAFSSVVGLALVACSSSSSDKPTPAQDAGTTSDAGGSDSAPVDAGPDPKTACDALTTTFNASQKITLSAANVHPFAEAPTPSGGTVVEGIYRVTGYDEYLDGTSPTTFAGGTLQLAGGLYEIIVLEGPNQVTGGGSYTIADGKIVWKYGCGGVSFGPSNGVDQKGPFTATATTLTFIVTNPSKTLVTKTVYTKD